jgi:chemotaxis protein MotB
MSVDNFLKKAKAIEKQNEERPEAKEESGAHGDDESNWLVSYADMMTLLCGFFIMMFSMAKMDEPKYELMKASVAKSFGGEYKLPSQGLADHITQLLHEAGIEKDTVVKIDTKGVVIAFSSTIFFDTLSAEVKPAGVIVLNKLIEGIAHRQGVERKSYKIVVEGHTDSRPIVAGMYPSNWELSASRAARVVRMYLDRGFQPNHLTAIGYADTHPEVNPRLPDGRLDEAKLARNRRVVIQILEPHIDSIPYPEEASPAGDGVKGAMAGAGGAPSLSTDTEHPITGSAAIAPVVPGAAPGILSTGHAPAGQPVAVGAKAPAAPAAKAETYPAKAH